MTIEKISEGLVQTDVSAGASSEKFTRSAEWLPIETAPMGPIHFDAWQVLRDADGNESGVRITDIRWSLDQNAFVNTRGEPVEYIYADGTLYLTHWMPLPSPPGAEVTSPNESESDAVSLNQSLSESIRSLTKAGKGE